MVSQPWNLSKNHIFKFVLSTLIKNSIIKIHPAIQNSFNNISLPTFLSEHSRPPKNLSVLPEDLKLDYGESFSFK